MVKYKVTANLYFDNKQAALRFSVKHNLDNTWTKSKLRSFIQVEECHCDEELPHLCNVLRYIEKE